MLIVINRNLSGNFVIRHFLDYLSGLLPRRFKRLIYVASVLGTVIQNQRPDPRLLEPINDLLKIAYTVPGLLLPIYYHGSIWKGAAQEEITLTRNRTRLVELKLSELAELDLWRIGVFFARRSNNFFRYGSEELMAADIHDLLSILKNLPCGRRSCLDCSRCSLDSNIASSSDELLNALRTPFDDRKK